MRNEDGALAFDAVVNNTNFNRQIDEMKRRVRSMTTDVELETGKMDNAFRTLGTAIGGYFTFTALRSFTSDVIKVRGEFQKLDIAFESMLKSRERADKLMAQIVRTAATTPFDLQGVANGAKQLLAYGTAAEEVNDTLVMLGNIASGLSIPLNDLVYLYGTTQVQGRLYAKDMLQFMGRGIPLVQELAKEMGKTTSEIQEMVSAGQIGFPEVQRVLQGLTSETGVFYNLMERQSKTLAGLASNLGDAWDRMLNEIGSDTQGILAAGLKGGILLLDNYDKVGKALMSIVAAYGSYKAALIAVNLLEKANVAILRQSVIEKRLAAMAGIQLTNAQARQAAMSKLISAANLRQLATQIKLNAAILANPYIAATAALVGLGVAIYQFRNRATQAERAQESFNKSFEKIKEITNDQANQAGEYIRILKDETETQYRKNKAYEELIKLMPNVFSAMEKEKLILKDISELQSMVNLGRDRAEIDQAKKGYDEIIAKIEEVERTIEKVRGFRSNTLALADLEKTKSLLQEEARLFTDQIKDLEKKEWEANTPVEERIRHYESLKNELKKQLEELDNVQSKSQAISDIWGNFPDPFAPFKASVIKKELDGVTGILDELQTSRGQTVKERIEELRKDLNREEKALRDLKLSDAVFDLEAINTAEENVKRIKDELSKLQPQDAPFGSIKYWEEVAKKAEEIIQTTPKNNAKELIRQAEIKLNAEEKAEEMRLLVARRSLDEEIRYKQTQYELYYRWIEAYGKESADKQFEDLISQNKTYIEYLESELQKLERKRETGGLSSRDQQAIVDLNTKILEASGAKTPIDIFRDSLDKAKDQTQTLTQYLQQLRKEQEALAGDRTSLGIEKSLEINKRIADAENELSQNLKRFLEDRETSEEAQYRIAQQYAELRIELAKQEKEGRVLNYEEALKKIDDAEKIAISEQQKRLLEASDYYRKIYGDIARYGIQTLSKLAEDTRQAFESATSVSIEGKDYVMIDVPAINEEGEAVKRTVTLTIEEFERLKAKYIEVSNALRAKNPFKAIKNEYESLVKAIKAGDMDALGDSLAEIELSAQQSIAVLNEWGDSLEAILGDQVGKAVSDLTELYTGMVNFNIGVLKLVSGDIIGGITGILSGLASMVKVFTRGAQEYYEKRAEWQRQLNQLQLEYNQLLNEQIRLQRDAFDSVFISSYENKLVKAFDAFEDAQKQITKLIDGLDGMYREMESKAPPFVKIQLPTVTDLESALNALQIRTGTKKGGLFGWGKPQDVFGSLLEAYPELIDGNGKLNKELAETILKLTDGVPQATREFLQGMLDYEEAMAKAMKQVEDVISELAGALSSDLRSALVNAFREGEDAANAWANTIENRLGDIISQLIFQNVFAKAFSDLQESMAASFGPGGDGSWIDDFAVFFSEMPKLSEEFKKRLEEAQSVAGEFGMNLFKADSDQSRNAMSGIGRAITEDTGRELVGIGNGMRLNLAAIKQVNDLQLTTLNRSVTHLARIEHNTEYCIKLESIDARLGRLENEGIKVK